MDWIELIVHTTTEGAESVSFELIELGSAGIVYYTCYNISHW